MRPNDFQLVAEDDGRLDEIADAAISAMTTRPAQTEQQPVGHVYTMQPCFPGEPMRAHAQLHVALPAGTKLYAAPIAQTAPQPEQSALVLPHAQLERIERRLTDWLELNCCECESGHSCGRNEVTADRDAIRAALSAQGDCK